MENKSQSLQIEDLPNEEWRDIQEFKGYKVSNLGRIKSLKNNIIKKQNKTIKGYYYVNLSNANINKNRMIHRLIGLTFISNPNNKPTINHINGIKTDNSLNNIEWNTFKENNDHAKAFGLNKQLKHAVIQMNLNGEYIKEFDTIYKAEMELNISLSKSKIRNCCKGTRKTAYGFKWKYRD